MASLNLLTRDINPAGVARRLRELCPDVAIDGRDDNWHSAVVTINKGTKQTLTLTHDPSSYAEPLWTRQMDALRGHLFQFPDTPRKDTALLLTTTLKFSLVAQFDPDVKSASDARLQLVFALAEFLDGVLFTPKGLCDVRGRGLFGASGAKFEDHNAVWPRVLAIVPPDTELGAMLLNPSHRKSAGADEAGTNAPSPNRVLRRALALMAVTMRAILEEIALNPHAKDRIREVLGWVEDVGINNEFEPHERQLMAKPLGQLENREKIYAAYRLESLGVLAWALGRFDPPVHDVPVDNILLWRSFGMLDSNAHRMMMARPTLRPREEIRALRKRLFALHWRLRDYYLTPKPMNFAEFAQKCNFGPLDITGLPLIDGDLSLGGKRIDRAEYDVYSITHSAAQERHQAVNWLWEGPATYSEASIST